MMIAASVLQSERIEMRSSGVAHMFLSGNGQQRRYPDAVSYTHLDVYKRQDKACDRPKKHAWSIPAT